MRHDILVFLIAAFVLLLVSRLALAAWQWPRVRKAGGLRPLLLGGLRIDVHQIAVMVALPAVLSPWLAHSPAAATASAIWLQVCWILLGFLEVATPAFIKEYDTRPNRLFVEYLKHPREVSGMLWRGYKLELAGALVAVVVLLTLGHILFGTPQVEARWPWWQMALGSVVFQIAEWARTHRYCGVCATPMVPLSHELCMRCPSCKQSAYPRVSPAMMVLIRKGDQILLARHSAYATARHTALAGFVEAGESIEDAIHREVYEEVGLRVTDLRYFGSQSWPFPHSLMIAFTAEYVGGDLRLQADEISEARWYGPGDTLPEIPMLESIAGRLVRANLPSNNAGF